MQIPVHYVERQFPRKTEFVVSGVFRGHIGADTNLAGIVHVRIAIKGDYVGRSRILQETAVKLRHLFLGKEGDGEFAGRRFKVSRIVQREDQLRDLFRAGSKSRMAVANEY